MEGCFFRESAENLNAFLILLALFGVFICLVWFFWIKHNDVWHSVWIGCLRNIENELLGENSNLAIFSAKAEEIALSGGRFLRGNFRGHTLAICIPSALILGWLSLLIIVLKC